MTGLRAEQGLTNKIDPPKQLSLQEQESESGTECYINSTQCDDQNSLSSKKQDLYTSNAAGLSRMLDNLAHQLPILDEGLDLLWHSTFLKVLVWGRQVDIHARTLAGENLGVCGVFG